MTYLEYYNKLHYQLTKEPDNIGVFCRIQDLLMLLKNRKVKFSADIEASKLRFPVYLF